MITFVKTHQLVKQIKHMGNPLVSILITAYNREKYISDAIMSASNQTYSNLEIIILDDASTDDSLKIANEHSAKNERIKVYKNEKNLGQFPTRNKIAKLANGKYIKYLDSDDLLYPHCIQVMVWAMEQFPNAGIGLSKNYRSDYIYPVLLTSKQAYDDFFANDSSFFVHAPNTTIINREKFLSFGGMRENWGITADMWFNFEFIAINDVVLMPQGLVFYRLGHDQASNEHSVTFHLKTNFKYLPKVISNSACPLDLKRKETIIKQLKGNYLRYIVRQLLKLKTKLTYDLLKEIHYKDFRYLFCR